MSKKKLYLKVEEELANHLTSEYEKQMKAENGIPFKGDYFGAVFEDMVNFVNEKHNPLDNISEDAQIDVDEADSPIIEEKTTSPIETTKAPNHYKFLFFTSIAILVIMMWLYFKRQ